MNYKRKAEELTARNAALAADYMAGLSLAEVAHLYRVSRQRVHQVLVDLGVERRKVGRGKP